LTFTVYILKEPDGITIRYVGITSKTVEERFKFHLKDGKGKAVNYKSKWIKSLLEKNLLPTYEILKENLTEEEAKAEERTLITEFKNSGIRLTNGTGGGDGCFNPSAEVREKMRLSHLGKGHTLETRLKMGISRTGSRRSETTKKLLSSQKMGVNNPRFGKYKQRVAQIDLISGEILAVHDSVTLAAKAMGIVYVGISATCKGRRKSAAGFQWKYINE